MQSTNGVKKITLWEQSLESNRAVSAEMNIGELMTAVVASTEPQQPLEDAVAIMHEHNCSCVLVTENNRPVGILTERDVVRIFADALADGRLPNFVVADVMSREPVCVHADSSLYDALVLARSRRLRHLLVVDEQEHLVGIVTQTDMVDAYVGLIKRQSELESENKELQLLSNEDALMGIGNRRAMEVDLNYTEAAAKRYHKVYAVALLDVDFFKKFNDRYGHHRGDQALKALAKAVQGSMRDSDRLYRYGGEELLLLMPEAGAVEAYVAAERVREAVQAMNMPHEGSPYGVLTVSVGVAAEAAESWVKLLERADTALYNAKASGRNKVSDKVSEGVTA